MTLVPEWTCWLVAATLMRARSVSTGTVRAANWLLASPSTTLKLGGLSQPTVRSDLNTGRTLSRRHHAGNDVFGKELGDAKALYAEFVDVARAGASHDQLRADIAAAGSARRLADLGIPDDSSWIWDWYDKVGNYDNASAWGAVRVPVLLLFGADDALVPPLASITQTTAILRSHGNDRVIARVFQGADHTLRVPASTPDGWPHNAAGFPQIIVTFARGELQR